FIGVVFQQRLTETIQRSQRSTQVVGYGIAEGFQLFIDRLKLCRSFTNAAFQFNVQVVDFFQALAICDVSYRADDRNAVVGLYGAETDFDRELASIFAQREQFQTYAHRANTWLCDIAVTVGAVAAAERFGHEHLDRLPQQFVTGVPKHLFGLGIYPFDLGLSVDDDHGVRRGFEQRGSFFNDFFQSLRVGTELIHQQAVFEKRGVLLCQQRQYIQIVVDEQRTVAHKDDQQSPIALGGHDWDEEHQFCADGVMQMSFTRIGFRKELNRSGHALLPCS